MKNLEIKNTLWIPLFLIGFISYGKPTTKPTEDITRSTITTLDEKTRTFNFDFQNAQNLPLKISNAYGKVELKNWDKKEIKVTVRVTAKNVSSKNAEEVLNRVEIDQIEDGNGLSFTTKIKRGDWKDLIFNGTSSVSIDYEVFLPQNNTISVSNSYGKIILPNRTGAVTIQLAYGDLDAKSLQHANNQIKASYSNLLVEKIHKGTVSAAYSKVQVKQADDIKASLTYSSGALFENISTALNGAFTYSSGLKVQLGEKIQNVKISSTYSNINLITHPQSNFDFNITTTYGKIKLGGSKATLQKEVEKNSHRAYNGYWGRQNSNNKFNITATYGNVEIQ